MGFAKEFREFALKGNMIDMAVGIIIGGAFGTVVASLVGDVLKPPLDYLVARGQPDPAGLKLEVGRVGTGETAKAFFVDYGKFLNACLSFLIVALAVFLLVKMINSARRRFEAEKPAPAPAGPSNEEKLLAEIRDAIKAK